VIEVNLLPGGKKSAPRGDPFAFFKNLGSKFGGSGGGGSARDPYMLFFAVAASILIGYAVVTFLGAGNQREELEVRLEEERQDSIVNAATIEQTNALTARRDSIAARVAVIQEIDAGRYVWAHILDEVGAAVPEFLWLREIAYAGDNPLTLRIGGRAGSTFAVTNFMRRLEASRFLASVQLQDMQLQPSEADANDLVQVFELLVEFDMPPLDELETVPLFGESAAQVATPGN
jgi:Tfp pilus assembly protein PilN